MTSEQFISIYTITLAIVGPVVGSVIYLVEKEKTKRVTAKENSVGAKAIADVFITLSEHGDKFLAHEARLKNVETNLQTMAKEYLDTLKEVLHHYTQK